MGRELKRVSLDFKDYEVDKPYQGYINPHEYQECKCCDGEGVSVDYRKFRYKWYGYYNENWKPNPHNPNARYNANAWQYNLDKDDVKALIDNNRLNGLIAFHNGKIPNAKEVNEWNIKSVLGHNSTSSDIVIKSKLKRLNLKSKCSACNGSGENWNSEQEKELYHNWEKIEPPQGDGFQLWSTTSDKPISPVFDTLEKLCVYLVENDVSIFAYETLAYEEWHETLSKDVIVYETEIGTFI